MLFPKIQTLLCSLKLLYIFYLCRTAIFACKIMQVIFQINAYGAALVCSTGEYTIARFSNICIANYVSLSIYKMSPKSRALGF